MYNSKEVTDCLVSILELSGDQLEDLAFRLQNISPTKADRFVRLLDSARVSADDHELELQRDYYGA